MQYFENTVSNTLAGSSVQTFFRPQNSSLPYTGRVFYKAFAGGRYAYSFLFSGRTDSSVPIENATARNTLVTGWEILSARVGICARCTMEEMPNIERFTPLTFAGQAGKRIEDGEFFTTDEVELCVNKGEYLCLEVTYRGEKIPHHHENSIPAFLQTSEGWLPSNRAVFPSMVGCNRPVKKRVAFFGDSITQGLGTPPNEYLHWNALLAEGLGMEYAFWNLGIGYGMANDGATGGNWLYKAKQNDVVIVCFGVNDIFRVGNAAQTKKDLQNIAEELKAAGCQVVWQTIPPFNYDEEKRGIWEELNRYIVEELSKKVDLVLDIAPLLGENGQSKYEPHPNVEGCAVWAESIYPQVKRFLEEK